MGITRKLDLRTGRSIWEARSVPRVPETPLTQDLRCNVLVVGAGISGALIAESLADAGLDVAVVDRRGALRGSTTATTSLIEYALDVPLVTLSERIGRDNAMRIWRRSRLAVDALRERMRSLRIRAYQANRDALYLSGDELDREGLEREAEARRHAGFNVTLCDAHEVREKYGVPGRSALRTYDDFEADPRRLAAGFLQAAMARGARVHAPVEVTDVEAGEDGVLATTRAGPQIRCRHAVFATGYEQLRCLSLPQHPVFSTWAIATKSQPALLWPGRCFIWEASQPYLYLRVSPDGRVICGGEDEEFSDEAARDALLGAKTAALESKLKALMPALNATAEFAWCGSFGASDTGMPTIGAVPNLPRCYVAMGYGGNGITFSMMAAQMIRGFITGTGDADADLVALC